MKKPVYKLLDEKGRILIPKEFRQMAELESGDIVKLSVSSGKIMVSNASPAVLGHLSKNIRIAVLKTPLVDEDVGIAASIRIVNPQSLKKENFVDGGTATGEMLDFLAVRTAFTATEAAKYNQLRGGLLRKKMPSLSHKNLPLAMFLETSDLGYPAWSGSKTEKANDEDIIRALGLGIVRFNEVVTPEVIEADYEYRVDTDVITAVTVSGGQSDPDNSVTVTFSILGRSYKVENVYYPEDGQQLVWVKWHTPSTEQHITISVTARGGSASVSRGTITANIVDLDDNPPPNPVADDRNDSYRKENAVMPVNPEKTQAAWSVWKAKWKEKWVWHSDWNWESEDHSASCEAGCTQSHGYWQDDGEYVDEGWWEFEEKHYSASLTADMHLVTDEKAPTADGMVTKSGYGVNVSLSARASSSQTSATTAPQTAVSYFPEFYYETYWRLLERTRNGYSAVFEFKNNEYSTYYRRTHFTPVWMPDGEYRVYTYLLDCWTPDGMLSVNLSNAVQISGSLWDDWHIAPQNVR